MPADRPNMVRSVFLNILNLKYKIIVVQNFFLSLRSEYSPPRHFLEVTTRLPIGVTINYLWGFQICKKVPKNQFYLVQIKFKSSLYTVRANFGLEGTNSPLLCHGGGLPINYVWHMSIFSMYNESPKTGIVRISVSSKLEVTYV